MEPNRLIRLGDNLNGTVTKATGGARFLVRSNDAPKSWKIELHSRRPELVQIGMHTTFWVGRVSPVKGEILVYDDDHGRMPISDTMRPRYLAAIQTLLGEIEMTGDALGDARSMIARIGNQNQSDWLTVWKLLSEPGPGPIKSLLASIDAMRTARKESPESLPELLATFSELYGNEFREAARRLS
jgi:hypothetical protein